MPVTTTWTNPTTTLDLAVGNVITEGWMDSVASNLLLLGGTTGLVHTGAYTISGGGFIVISGNVGIGSAAQPQAGLTMAGSILSGATSQYGMLIQPVSSNSATSAVFGIQANAATAATGFTAVTVASFYAGNPSKGAGSTITNAYGMLVDPITAGNSNNYGILVNAPSGGSGNNHGIYVAGGTPAIYVQSGGITVALGDLNVATGRVFAGASPAASQAVNVPNGNGIGFRNGANSGDCTITINSSNQLGFTNFATAAAAGAATGSLTVTINGVVRQINYT